MHYRKLMLHLPWSEIDTVFTLCDILSAPNNNYFFSFYSNPVDSGRKLNVHKTSRRRPRRLLNVLCTFNLRPVSTGKAVEDEDAGFKNFWLTLEEAVRYFFFKKKSQIDECMMSHWNICSEVLQEMSCRAIHYW